MTFEGNALIIILIPFVNFIHLLYNTIDHSQDIFVFFSSFLACPPTDSDSIIYASTALDNIWRNLDDYIIIYWFCIRLSVNQGA